MAAWVGRDAVLGALGLMLAGCASDPPPAAPVYASRPAVRLEVGSLDVQDRREPLSQANFIDERRGDELAKATETYLRSRFQAAGGAGSALGVVEQASLTERLIADRTGGVVGYVTGEPTYELAGTLTVRIVLRDAAGGERGFARASVARNRSVASRASITERDEAARALMTELLDQVDPALEQAVSQNLGARPAA